MYDGDNFYHLGHAEIYLQKGIFYRPFPWASYSMIGKLNSDLWWGFHVLLIPVWLLQNKVWALAYAPAFLIFLHLLITRTALVRIGINQWYSFAMLLGSFGYFSRMVTIRPQVVSTALLVLIYVSMSTQWGWVAVVSSVLLGLLHPTLGYMVFLVAAASVIQRRVQSGKWNGWLELSCIFVVLTAAVLRPGIPEGLQLLKIQLFDLMIAKQTGAIRNFGNELSPAHPEYFVNAFLTPCILMLVALLFSFRDRAASKASKTPALGALLVTLVALGIAFGLTKRGVDQFVPFGILTALMMIHRSGGITVAPALLIAAHSLIVVGQWGVGHWNRPNRYNAQVLRGAAEWCAKNTTKGEIIGQAVWSDFSSLFYWNKHNRYFGGMDPIFQYTYDKQKYWLMNLAAPGRDLGTTSTSNPLDTFDGEAPVSELYPRLMKAKYLVTSTGRNAAFHEAIMKDKNVKLVFDDGQGRVYRLGN